MDMTSMTDEDIEVDDGAGCVEIWEKLSERRNESDDDDD